jgi:hypothetical protein
MARLKDKERWFLGGTCAETTWRQELIPLLEENGIEYFNPVVEDWTPECQQIEEDEKNNKCNVHLYVITPAMQGVYSIAEIVNSAHQANFYGTKVERCLFFVLKNSENVWTPQQEKSLKATMELVTSIADNYHSEVGFIDSMKTLVELAV